MATVKDVGTDLSRRDVGVVCRVQYDGATYLRAVACHVNTADLPGGQGLGGQAAVGRGCWCDIEHTGQVIIACKIGRVFEYTVQKPVSGQGLSGTAPKCTDQSRLHLCTSGPDTWLYRRSERWCHPHRPAPAVRCHRRSRQRWQPPGR